MTAQKPVKVVFLGLGNIGHATAKLMLHRYAEVIRIEKVMAVPDRAGINERNARELGLEDRVHWVESDDCEQELERNVSDDVQIVVDITGANEAAKRYVRKALDLGKHVVTATKPVISEEGEQLREIAANKNLMIKFEACVGGPIPMIRMIQDYFVTDRIEKVVGVLNGTTNWILDQMKHSTEAKNVWDFVKEANRLGICEPDPTNDLNGTDVVHKLAILASLAFQTTVTPRDIREKGIVQGIIDPDLSTLHVREIPMHGDVKRGGDYSLKLLGIAEEHDGEVSLGVYPCYIPAHHYLSKLPNERNGLWVKCAQSEDFFVSGPGAGPNPTAIAVAADILEIARRIDDNAIQPFSGYGGARCGIRDIKELPTQGVIISHSPLLPPEVYEIKSRYLRNRGISKSSLLDVMTEYDVPGKANPYAQYVDGEYTPDLIRILSGTEQNVRDALKDLEELKTLPASQRVAAEFNSRTELPYMHPEENIIYVRIKEDLE